LLVLLRNTLRESGAQKGGVRAQVSILNEGLK
jgi:hypothetical protein